MRAIPAAAAILSLAACATVPADGEPPVRAPRDTCKAEAGQRFVGQKATAETGAAILAATGASELRWLPPGIIVTMEYKFGRVGVAYDAGFTITRVSCG
jgi:hypothetical protein